MGPGCPVTSVTAEPPIVVHVSQIKGAMVVPSQIKGRTAMTVDMMTSCELTYAELEGVSGGDARNDVKVELPKPKVDVSTLLASTGATCPVNPYGNSHMD